MCWACAWLTQIADRRLLAVEAKGGQDRVVLAANRLFDAPGDFPHDERPDSVGTDRIFVVLKGPRRGRPLSAEGLDAILDGAPGVSTPPATNCGIPA
jgi:integrase/recombinase XerD